MMKPVEDPDKFREALGAFATGVTVITALGPRGEPVGFTASSFNSVSLDPPLVLFSLDKQASVLPAYLSTRHFAVNVLREDQRSLSDHFANFKGDRWEGLEYETWETGCPILADALASFECDYRYTYDGGDHVIFVGEVKRMDLRGVGRPLVYFGGTYHRIDPDSEDSEF